MKRLIFKLMAISSFFNVTAQEMGDLTINIDVVEHQGKGQLVFLLFDQENGFPKEVEKAKFRADIKEVKAKMSHTFKNIPYGEYAICVFHDENENGVIDSNFIGMPKEHVATSNMTGMGKPTFRKCEIAIFRPKKSFNLDFVND